MELTGPQGKSFDAVKSFLNEIGPNWFPVELNPLEVFQREQNGADPAESCISEGFMKAYFFNRKCSTGPGSLGLSEAFSGLGAVMDWLAHQRNSIRKQVAKPDNEIKKEICKHRTKYKRNPLPLLGFKSSRPATFVTVNLLRTLVAESNQWKTNDGLDFCHAAMASAFASIATLDKHWKRRIENLPKPNRLAHIYYQPQLDKMVDDIESWLKQRRSGGALNAR